MLRPRESKTNQVMPQRVCSRHDLISGLMLACLSQFFGIRSPLVGARFAVKTVKNDENDRSYVGYQSYEQPPSAASGVMQTADA